MQSLYWAEFKEVGQDVFRLNTRIYINEIEQVQADDKVIGAIIGKNPGSAITEHLNAGIQSIKLQGDKLLPTVRNIVLKAYQESDMPVPDRGYIQVLNLFYLYNPDLKEAIQQIEQSNTIVIDSSENCHFPWAWYVWGGQHKKLDVYKSRFNALKTNHHFYFDKHQNQIVKEPVSATAFAKHTQGLKHEVVVKALAGMIREIEQAGTHL